MDVQNSGSGGLGAVSAGIAEWAVVLILLGIVVVVLLGAWKLTKILWAMFSGG